MHFVIFSENFVGYRGYDIFAGAEVLLLELCSYLTSLGHRVTVIQFGSKRAEFEFKGIHVKQFVNPFPPFFQKMGLTTRFHTNGLLLKRYIDRTADRVHLHYFYNGFPFGSGDMTGTCHGVEWDCPNPYRGFSMRQLRDRFSFWTMKRIAHYALRSLGRIWANDYTFIKYVQSWAPQFRDKVWYIPNFVDTHIFGPHRRPNPEIMDRFGDKVKVLIPKFLTAERGTDLALEALAALRRREVVLLLAGFASEPEYYRKRAMDLGVAEQVVFLGHKDHYSEMPELYAAADVVLIPSHCREGTALAALEAMATRKPVVATNVGGLTEVVIDKWNGRIARPNPEDLARCLESLVDAQDLRDVMGQRGLEMATAIYSKKEWQQRVRAFFGL